jgi:hypothetical protein
MLAFLRRCGAESLDHFHQAGERVGLHFLHHLTSVCLDRDLADAELATDCLSAGQEAQGAQADGITECRW